MTVNPTSSGACGKLVSSSKNNEKSNEMGWAPLRDSYTLTSSKLKDWDKMAEPATVVGQEHESSESSDE
ncbi:hypothetical protein OPV22_005661 [Ensete ventricosum]|uniref:Uncharacterized protein n=1 Tax=Ensete ventricosum TaxID=4639 RepID=A0AAV8RDA7_ENSVE|nr:hypothetical protein OPV22_005661 [Ensete ventricosum]